MFFDPTYMWMVVVPGLVLGGLATLFTRTTFARYARVRASSGLTGAEAAQRMLEAAGVHEVAIEETRGFLSDHFDPARNVLRLSPEVFRSDSLSAIGVACHEAGHALQKAHRYAPLGMRTALVPVAQLGSTLYVWVIMAGFFMRAPALVQLGILMLAATVLFSLVTLPVEWNATARAKQAMVAAGVVTPQEQPHAGAVLNAAFLTYVASALTAVLTLLYYLSIARRR
jgi:Zn-dependent membrane protease YugP